MGVKRARISSLPKARDSDVAQPGTMMVDLNGTVPNLTQTVMPPVVRNTIAALFVVLAVAGSIMCIVMLCFLIVNDKFTYVPVGRAFVSLFFCVLLRILTQIPITTVKMVLIDWDFDDATCLTVGVLNMYLYCIYVMHFLFLLSDMYISLGKLDQNEYTMNKSCYSLLLSLVWVVAGVLCTVLFFGHNGISYIPDKFTCGLLLNVSSPMFYIVSVAKAVVLLVIYFMAFKIITLRRAGLRILHHLSELNFPTLNRDQLKFKKQLKWLKSTLVITVTNCSVEVITQTLFTLRQFLNDPEYHHLDTIGFVVECLALSVIPLEFIFSNTEVTHKVFWCTRPSEGADMPQGGGFRIVAPNRDILEPRPSVFITDDLRASIDNCIREESSVQNEVRYHELEVSLDNSTAIVHKSTINLRSELTTSTVPVTPYTEQMAMSQLASPSDPRCSSQLSINTLAGSSAITTFVQHAATSGEHSRVVTPIEKDRLPVSPGDFTTLFINKPDGHSVISTTVNDLGQMQVTDVFFDRGFGARSPSISSRTRLTSPMIQTVGEQPQHSTNVNPTQAAYLSVNALHSPSQFEPQFKQMNAPPPYKEAPVRSQVLDRFADESNLKRPSDTLPHVPASLNNLHQLNPSNAQGPITNFINNIVQRRASMVSDNTMLVVVCSNNEHFMPGPPIARNVDRLFLAPSAPFVYPPDSEFQEQYRRPQTTPSAPTMSDIANGSEQNLPNTHHATWIESKPWSPRVSSRFSISSPSRSPDLERKLVPPPVLISSDDVHDDDLLTIDATNQYDARRMKEETGDPKVKSKSTLPGARQSEHLPLNQTLQNRVKSDQSRRTARGTAEVSMSKRSRTMPGGYHLALLADHGTEEGMERNISSRKSLEDVSKSRKHSEPTRPKSVFWVRPKTQERKNSREEINHPASKKNSRTCTPVPRVWVTQHNSDVTQMRETSSPTPTDDDCVNELPNFRKKGVVSLEKRELYHRDSMVYLGLSSNYEGSDEDVVVAACDDTKSVI